MSVQPLRGSVDGERKREVLVLAVCPKPYSLSLAFLQAHVIPWATAQLHSLTAQSPQRTAGPRPRVHGR
jgi:hypothetical protein